MVSKTTNCWARDRSTWLAGAKSVMDECLTVSGRGLTTETRHTNQRDKGKIALYKPLLSFYDDLKSCT